LQVLNQECIAQQWHQAHPAQELFNRFFQPKEEEATTIAGFGRDSILNLFASIPQFACSVFSAIQTKLTLLGQHHPSPTGCK
jgi:hypothetical protein